MSSEKFTENIILKGILEHKQLAVLVSNQYRSEYFSSPIAQECFKIINKHLKEYSTLPTKDIIIGESSEDEKMKDLLDDVYALDLDVAKNYDYILENANTHLKDKAIKEAIFNAVNIIEDKGDIAKIRRDVEEALCKDLKINLGLDYFGDLRSRLERIFDASLNKIPTYYPAFDEIINGGFTPFTLSIIISQIHGGKSNWLANIAARQVLNGHNVVLFTLEMSEDAFAQRFDSILTLCDINRMYTFDSMKKTLVERLSKIKKAPNRGQLYIKEFPPGKASVKDFRAYLRELQMRDINPDIVLFDYINLLKPELSNVEDLYSKVKLVAEEARAMSFEFEIPFVSVSQLNRGGAFEDLKNVNWNSIAESIGLIATVDFAAIMGASEDEFVYESEMHYKVEKNRLGGRCGDFGKFYLDKVNLKMYDSTEQDLWLNDARISNDDRNLFGEGDE